MLAFFASIGLNAKLSTLKSGGPMLLRFLLVVLGLLVLQDALGIGLAKAIGLDPLLGLLAGSITLSGGHGTGAAWSKVFAERHGLQSTTEAAIACATFGLVLGGLLGGPVARLLTRRLGTPQPVADTPHDANDTGFEHPRDQQSMTPAAFINTVALFAIALSGGTAIEAAIRGTAFELPTFVCVLFVGVLLSNGLALFGWRVSEHAVALLGNVSLSLFLAMALMTLRLWELTSLALPMVILLVAQTTLMVVYAGVRHIPADGRELRRGGARGRPLRLRARRDADRDRQHAGGHRTLRPVASRVRDRADGQRILHRYRERARDQTVPRAADLRLRSVRGCPLARQGHARGDGKRCTTPLFPTAEVPPCPPMQAIPTVPSEFPAPIIRSRSRPTRDASWSPSPAA